MKQKILIICLIFPISMGILSGCGTDKSKKSSSSFEEKLLEATDEFGNTLMNIKNSDTVDEFGNTLMNIKNSDTVQDGMKIMNDAYDGFLSAEPVEQALEKWNDFQLLMWIEYYHLSILNSLLSDYGDTCFIVEKIDEENPKLSEDSQALAKDEEAEECYIDNYVIHATAAAVTGLITVRQIYNIKNTWLGSGDKSVKAFYTSTKELNQSIKEIKKTAPQVKWISQEVQSKIVPDSRLTELNHQISSHTDQLKRRHTLIMEKMNQHGLKKKMLPAFKALYYGGLSTFAHSVKGMASVAALYYVYRSYDAQYITDSNTIDQEIAAIEARMQEIETQLQLSTNVEF